MKKLLALFLALAAIMSLMSTTALAVDRKEGLASIITELHGLGYTDDDDVVKAVKAAYEQEVAVASPATAENPSAPTAVTTSSVPFLDVSFDTSKAYTERPQNFQDYDESYCGIKLFAGPIRGLITSDENLVAELTRIWKSQMSAMGSFEVNAFLCYLRNARMDGETILDTAKRLYPNYDKSIQLRWEDTDKTRDVLFRLVAAESGVQSTGLLLPRNCQLDTIDGPTLYFRENGAGYYTFPCAHSAMKTALHDPY